MINLFIAIKKFLYDQYKLLDYALNSTYYYKSLSSKSKFRVNGELLNWYYRYGERNKMYFAWGLNEKGKLLSDYMSRKEFFKDKIKVRKISVKVNL